MGRGGEVGARSGTILLVARIRLWYLALNGEALMQEQVCVVWAMTSFDPCRCRALRVSEQPSPTLGTSYLVSSQLISQQMCVCHAENVS